MRPVADTVTVPFGTEMVCAVPEIMVTPLILVMVSGCPSGSLSFPRRLRMTGMLAFVVVRSSRASGSLFTISIWIVVSSVFPKVSAIVYGNNTGQLNPGSATKLIAPVDDTMTVHPLTGILWAVPEVIAIPLMLVIVNVPNPTSFPRRFNGIVALGSAT